MIITEEKEQLHYINKLMKEKHRHIYRMRHDGLLEYDGDCMTQRFLAYIDGKWYGSKAGRQGASEGVLEEIKKRKFLFAITESRYWQIREDRKVEYASPSKPLSEDAVMFFMAVQKGILCLYIIDGSKNKAPLMLGVPKEEDTEKIFAQSIIAMTRQYDPDAAKEMEDFWFAKEELDLSSGHVTVCNWDIGVDPNAIRDYDCPPWEE